MDLLNRNFRAFDLLSRNINITGIMNPFIAEYDINVQLGQVKEDLTSKAKKYDHNLYKHVALVTQGGKPVGYLNPIEILNSHSLNDNQSLEQCVKDIPLMRLNDFNSLVEFADFVGWDDPPAKYFVFKEDECIGWLTYSDINKSFMHISLFALILELEENMLRALRVFPRAFDLLDEKRRQNAGKICKTLMREKNMVGPPSYQDLLEGTTLFDRFNMIKWHPVISTYCSDVLKDDYSNLLETIRNKIAHAGLNSNLAKHIPRKDLFPLIGWAITLSGQLEKFSGDKSIYQ